MYLSVVKAYAHFKLHAIPPVLSARSEGLHAPPPYLVHAAKIEPVSVGYLVHVVRGSLIEGRRVLSARGAR